MLKIVTDSAADLTPEEIGSLGIAVAPLLIQFSDGTINSEDISRDDFYARLKAIWPDIPTTSLPSPSIFMDIYRGLFAQGHSILSVHISSGLSNTLDAAKLGGKALLEEQVTFVDTETLSGGQRYQVLAAAMAARAGRSKEFILERLKLIRQATETIYTLETMEYLAKGGRIGRVQALAGILLNIKPVIHVDPKDGKYSTLGKERTIPRALQAIGAHLAKKYGDTKVWVSVMHGQSPDYADSLAQLLQEMLNISKLEILRISPVLGVHTGPGIIGAAVVPIALMENLE